jgi:hypothetical protein
MSKKYFVEITIGAYMDEMDDDNSPDSIAEIADQIVYDAISSYWTSDVVTTVTARAEVHPNYTSEDILTTYTRGGLDSLRANGLQL